MKKILVPTDFSQCAQNALDAAIMLAKKFNASIHLFSLVEDFQNQVLIKEVENNFELIKKTHSNIIMTSSFAGGNLVEQIKKCTELEGIDFVVIGSHGNSGFSEVFIGSNTQKVVRSIHLPVLIIKGALKDINFKEIVFASNFNTSEQEPFLKFKELVSAFNPSIYLLGVKTSFFFDAPITATKAAMEVFQKLAAPFPCKKYIFKDADIEGSIREFSETVGADLIAISNYNRQPLKRMLVGSKVEALINHSTLPVLSIDFEKN